MRNNEEVFKNKTLLITGGTGSFGNAVLKRFLIRIFKKFVFFRGMKKSKMICANNIKNEKIKFFLGNVRDIDSVKNAMYGVDYVFHAPP